MGWGGVWKGRGGGKGMVPVRSGWKGRAGRGSSKRKSRRSSGRIVAGRAEQG